MRETEGRRGTGKGEKTVLSNPKSTGKLETDLTVMRKGTTLAQAGSQTTDRCQQLLFHLTANIIRHR